MSIVFNIQVMLNLNKTSAMKFSENYQSHLNWMLALEEGRNRASHRSRAPRLAHCRSPGSIRYSVITSATASVVAAFFKTRF